MRFQPIDYRKDFAFVRQIDDSFDPRFGQQRNVKMPEDVRPGTSTVESESLPDEGR